MPMADENVPGAPILAGNNPQAMTKVRAGKAFAKSGSIGEQAMMDAVIVVVVAWLFLFFLSFSLRHHII